MLNNQRVTTKMFLSASFSYLTPPSNFPPVHQNVHLDSIFLRYLIDMFSAFRENKCVLQGDLSISSIHRAQH